MSKDIISGANINKAGVYPGWKMKKQAPGPGPEPVDDTFEMTITFTAEDEYVFSYSIDKTPKETVEAFEAGKTIVPKYSFPYPFEVGADVNYFLHKPEGFTITINEVDDVKYPIINFYAMGFLEEPLTASPYDGFILFMLYAQDEDTWTGEPDYGIRYLLASPSEDLG